MFVNININGIEFEAEIDLNDFAELDEISRVTLENDTSCKNIWDILNKETQEKIQDDVINQLKNRGD